MIVNVKYYCLIAFISMVTINQVFSQFTSPEDGELFRSDVVASVYITINQDSLDWILDPENKSSNKLHRATFIYNNGFVLDTLEEVGFRLRGNTSRGAAKKSFKVDFNNFVSGRKYHGIEKLNLNGEHNDPTISRSRISFDIAHALELPAPRTSHVKFYVNEEFFGVYINVEHIDEEFVKNRFDNQNGNLYKCLYPADMAYKGDDPNEYKEIIYGRRAYALKTNKATDDYSDLAGLIDVLNNTSSQNLACELEGIFNVDQYLKFIVFDILTGNWDGPLYNKNNFYLYHNEASDLIEYLPYDLDNSLGIDWLSRDWGNRNIYSWSQTGETRPLYNSILAVPEYRGRFSLYMKKALDEVYKKEELSDYIHDIRTQIYDFVEEDVYFTLDYGFDLSDFYDGFDIELDYFQTDYGINSFIETRIDYAIDQLEEKEIFPFASWINNNHPRQDESVYFQAKLQDNSEINKAEVCYSFEGSDFSCVKLFDDGMNDDIESGDDIFGGKIDPLGASGLLEYYIFIQDNTGKESTYPKCGLRSIIIDPLEIPLAINELLASNTSTNSDEYSEYDDWIELYNHGTANIFLGDKFLSDESENHSKWSLPNVILAPNEYYLIWADKDNEQGNRHTNFKLSSSGEHLGLYDDINESAIDMLEYPVQQADVSYGKIPNGTGTFQELTPTPQASNEPVKISNFEQHIVQLKTSPNPVSNRLKIGLSPHINNHESSVLSIYNSIGEQEHRIVVGIGQKEIDISIEDLPSGIYFLSLRSSIGKIISTGKIIKI